MAESTKSTFSCFKKGLSRIDIQSCSEVELKAIKKRYDECFRNLTGEAGWVGGDCVYAEQQETTKVLENVYTALVERAVAVADWHGTSHLAGSSGLAHLKEMHVLWKQLLKPTCRYETRESFGGTAYALYEGRCWTRHIRTRIKYYLSFFE